jgi:DNA modification methylase
MNNKEQQNKYKLITADAKSVLKHWDMKPVNCIVSSPPYYKKRTYKNKKAIGNEKNVNTYIKRLVDIFSLAKNVLSSDGLMFINIADSYDKNKNLIGIPFRLVIKLQNQGFILRNTIIWNIPNKIPESQTDRFSNRYEYVFMFAKSKKYYFNLDNVRVPIKTKQKKNNNDFYKKIYHSKSMFNIGYIPNKNGKNPGDVWSIANETKYADKCIHAIFPTKLVEKCLLAGCKQNGTVLDLFSGVGTTGMVAKKLELNYIGIEISAIYNKIAKKRIESFKWEK